MSSQHPTHSASPADPQTPSRALPGPIDPQGPEPRPVRQASPALTQRLRSLDEPLAGTPSASGRRRGYKSFFVVGGLLASLLIAAAIWSGRTVFGDPHPDLDLKFLPVERGKVTLTIVEKGEVEAVRNA